MDPSQRRLIFAVKVGIATMLTTLLTLVDDVYAFNELGAWATITVVITMQPTVGSTTNKGIQRCLGTVFAAAVAALVGVSARELLPWPEAGKVVVGLAVGSVTVRRHQPQPSPSPLTAHHSPLTTHLSPSPSPSPGAAQLAVDTARVRGVAVLALPLVPHLRL